MSYSYATERKIRIIENQMGPDWKSRRPDKSIDAIYTEIVGDTRKNVFCKISAETKTRLDEMIDIHKVSMADFIEQIINSEWTRYSQTQKQNHQSLVEEFSG